MKISRFLAIAGLVAAGTAAARGGGNSSILFKFDGGTGNQVFRSAAGVPTLNTVAGVNPAGAPWGITSFDATIKTNGDIRASRRRRGAAGCAMASAPARARAR